MVDRTLTGSVVTETISDDYIEVGFVELSLSSPARFWTGHGTFTATMPGESSQSWIGAGDVGTIDKILESINNAQNGVNFVLSGIDNDLLVSALTEDYQGRAAKVWVAYLDSSYAIIADPVLVFSGQMDVMSTEDGDETGSIFLSCESRDAILRRRSESLLTDEEQQRLFPGDKGLEFVTELQSKEVIWGKVGAGRGAADFTSIPDSTPPGRIPR